MTDWPVLVLTAGLGTRLRPLSYVRAKPAIPVAGEPLVCRILAWLSSQGVRRAVLNLHHKPETITTIVGDGSAFGISVSYSYEDPILGSAGGPRHALPLLDAARFFIVNGDTLSDVDLGALADRHSDTGALVTLALVEHPDPRRYGGVDLATDGRVTAFARKGTASAYHFVGAQAVSAEAFERVPVGKPAESVTWLYPRLLAERPDAVRGTVCRATFHDIGTPRDYLETSLAIAARENRAQPITGMRCVVDASARVEESVLWNDVVVEAGAVLRRCVVADNVTVPSGSRFEDTALVNGATVASAIPGAEVHRTLIVHGF